jgi:hypothetical protein
MPTGSAYACLVWVSGQRQDVTCEPAAHHRRARSCEDDRARGHSARRGQVLINAFGFVELFEGEEPAIGAAAAELERDLRGKLARSRVLISCRARPTGRAGVGRTARAYARSRGERDREAGCQGGHPLIQLSGSQFWPCCRPLPCSGSGAWPQQHLQMHLSTRDEATMTDCPCRRHLPSGREHGQVGERARCIPEECW